jgi:hypothetical protein
VDGGSAARGIEGGLNIRHGVVIRDCADREVRRHEVGSGDSVTRGGIMLRGFRGSGVIRTRMYRSGEGDRTIAEISEGPGSDPEPDEIGSRNRFSIGKNHFQATNVSAQSKGAGPGPLFGRAIDRGREAAAIDRAEIFCAKILAFASQFASFPSAPSLYAPPGIL